MRRAGAADVTSSTAPTYPFNTNCIAVKSLCSVERWYARRVVLSSQVQNSTGDSKSDGTLVVAVAVACTAQYSRFAWNQGTRAMAARAVMWLYNVMTFDLSCIQIHMLQNGTTRSTRTCTIQ